jgi:hypothetical protein
MMDVPVFQRCASHTRAPLAVVSDASRGILRRQVEKHGVALVLIVGSLIEFVRPPATIVPELRVSPVREIEYREALTSDNTRRNGAAIEKVDVGSRIETQLETSGWGVQLGGRRPN